MKKEKHSIHNSGNKKHSIIIKGKKIDLKETKNLFGRLMILASSNRDIDRKHAIGIYEFTVTPTSSFAPDGTVLVCSYKSKVIHSLKDLVAGQEEANHLQAMNSGQMVLVQKLNIKAAYVNTVKSPVSA